MSNEIIYYDDDGNLVYGDSAELFDHSNDSGDSFDSLESFRKKLEGREHEHYDNVIFIDKLEKIINQHPFVEIRSYLDDYLSGLSSFKIIKKYQLSSKLENYRIGTKYLGFSGKRATTYDDNKLHNLKNKVWNSKYNNLIKSFSFFKKELDNLIYHNVLRGFLIFYLSENSSKMFNLENTNELKNYCISSQDKINLFVTSVYLKDGFLDFLAINLENKIEIILNELKTKKIIFTDDGENYQIETRLMNLKKLLMGLLATYEQGITHRNFNYKIINKFPEFRLIPIDLIWNLILNPLETGEIIVRKRTQAWMGRPYTDMIFTKSNFDSTMKFLRDQLQQFGKLKFFGRPITPDKFIQELIELKKGDFDDLDDQITRLAGLCLADSVLTTSPHEELPDFDFSINVSDYRFRPEQIEAMKKSNFTLSSPILHCKVMINDPLDLSYLEYLHKIIPSGHQGIIFSFYPKNSSIQKFLKKDAKIQIIDEVGVRSWVEITDNIPCRVGAVAKIRFDPINDNRGKIVRVDSINYETGMSTVTILPTLKQANIHIRSLEEIPLNEKSNSEFTAFSRNYFEFLGLVSRISNSEEFNVAIFELIPDKIIEFNDSWRVNFGTITTEIFMNRTVRDRNYFCSCLTFSDDSTTLCRHLISSLNKIAIDEEFLQTPIRNENIMYESIMNFIAYLTYDQIDALTDFLDYDVTSYFKKFLENIITEKI